MIRLELKHYIDCGQSQLWFVRLGESLCCWHHADFFILRDRECARQTKIERERERHPACVRGTGQKDLGQNEECRNGAVGPMGAWTPHISHWWALAAFGLMGPDRYRSVNTQTGTIGMGSAVM